MVSSNAPVVPAVMDTDGPPPGDAALARKSRVDAAVVEFESTCARIFSNVSTTRAFMEADVSVVSAAASPPHTKYLAEVTFVPSGVPTA